MKKAISVGCIIIFAALLVVGAVFVLPKLSNNSASGNAGTASGKEDKNEIKFSDFNTDDIVTLGDYNNLVVDVKYTEVSEAAVINHINDTLEKYPDYEPTDAVKVKDGDIVNINYVGTQDGVAFEGGTAENQILEIGSNSYIDGFEEGLIDKKVGDTVTLNLTFPKDYKDSTGAVSEMAGAEVVFTVEIISVVQEVIRTYEEIDDTYCYENLGFDSKAELYDYIKESLSSKSESEKSSNTRAAVVDAVLSICTVKVPKALLEYQVEDYMNAFKESVEAANYDFKEYLSNNYGYTEEDFEEEVTTYMEQSLKEQFILTAIAKKENITIDEEGYAEYVDAFVSYYNYQSKEDLFKDYPDEEMRTAYLCNMTVDYLIENSTINYLAE